MRSSASSRLVAPASQEFPQAARRADRDSATIGLSIGGGGDRFPVPRPGRRDSTGGGAGVRLDYRRKDGQVGLATMAVFDPGRSGGASGGAIPEATPEPGPRTRASDR